MGNLQKDENDLHKYLDSGQMVLFDLFPFNTGMSMIAERFHDDRQRSWAMGFAMGGLALGILGELIGFTLDLYSYVTSKSYKFGWVHFNK